MKNALYAIIAILAICVAVLFYQVQSLKSAVAGESPKESKADIDSHRDKKPVIINASTDKLPDARIAYINVDTLNENYLLIADYVKVLRNKKMSLETQFQNMNQKFQEDYEAAQMAAQSGKLLPTEIEMKKRDLEQQQRELESKQIQMDKLAYEMQEKNDELQRTVKDFLIKNYEGKYDYILAYTSTVPNILLTNPKLEITYQVLDQLNAEYKSKKSSKK